MCKKGIGELTRQLILYNLAQKRLASADMAVAEIYALKDTWDLSVSSVILPTNLLECHLKSAKSVQRLIKGHLLSSSE